MERDIYVTYCFFAYRTYHNILSEPKLVLLVKCCKFSVYHGSNVSHPCSINAQQRPLCHSVPKTVHPDQSSNVRRNPKLLYGYRCTMLNAILERFTRRFALPTVYCLDEASFYCWDQRSRHSCLHLSSPRGYMIVLVGCPVDMIVPGFNFVTQRVVQKWFTQHILLFSYFKKNKQHYKVCRCVGSTTGTQIPILV